jgi:hypothetical protein
MKIIKSIVATTVLMFCAGSWASPVEVPKDSTVKVQWSNPQDYTDIEVSRESTKHFNKRLFTSLEKHFAKLGERLPQGYQWHIKVTDLDLAGKVTNYYAPRHKEIRVIDSWFRPQITFSYQVINDKGEVVANDDKLVLKENLIERFPSTQFMQKEFSYERYMIKRWFKNKLLPKLS